MTKRLLLVVLIVTAVVVGGAGSVSAKSKRSCTTVPTAGRNCVTITEAGSHSYRVRDEWKYGQPRNVGVPTPIKRSVWEANVVCSTRTGGIDVLRFYDSGGAEVLLDAAQRASMVAGLESSALPKLVKGVCGA